AANRCGRTPARVAGAHRTTPGHAAPRLYRGAQPHALGCHRFVAKSSAPIGHPAEPAVASSKNNKRRKTRIHELEVAAVMPMRSLLVGVALLLASELGLSLTAQMPGDGQLQQISGRIEDTNGNPLQGAVVELHSWSGGLIATESTNGVGAFEFRTTNSGPFELHVTHSGATETMQLESGANNNLTLRVPSDQPVGGAAPAAANSTVSLNDLEAPGKARSKL